MGTSFNLALKKSKKLIINNGNSKMNLKLQELTDKGGLGIALFFFFLKYLTITFGIMTIISLWPIYILFQGNGYTQDGEEIGFFDFDTHMARLSVGNLEVFSDSNKDQQNSNVDSLLIADFMITSVFFLFYIWYIQFTRKLKKVRRLLPSQYAIEITGFPKEDTQVKELREFFQKHGFQISDIFLARDYKNTLFFHQELIDIFQKLMNAKEAKEEREKKNEKKCCFFITEKFPQLFDQVYILDKKYKERQEQITEKVNKAFKSHKALQHDDYNSIKAYVVFQYQYEKVNVIKKFKKFQGSVLNIKKIPKEFKFLDKYNLKIEKKVDEPSSIRWENIEVSQSIRQSKSILVTIILIGFLTLCFALIILVNLFRPNTNTNTCTKKQWEETNVTWYIIYPDVHDGKCSKAMGDSFQSMVISLVIGIFVLGINTMLKMIIKSFSKFMRYTSIGQEIKASALQIFRAQFINTGLLIAVLQFDFGGVKIPQIVINILAKIDSVETNQVTYVNDFNRQFYQSIGGKIILTTSILIISPILFATFGVWIVNGMKHRLAKQKKTQREMDRALVPVEFDIATEYAVTLNTIFIALFYCSGIPILIPIGFTALTAQYWSLKYRILRFNKKPPALDSSINKKIISTIPYALLLHLIMGILIYSEKTIFSEGNQGTMNTNIYNIVESNTGADYQKDKSYFMQRLTHNYAYTLFSILMIFFYIIFTKFLKYFRKIMQCIDSKKKVGDQLVYKSYQEAYLQMEQYNLATYDIRKNPRYQFLVDAIDRASKYDQDLDEEERQRLEEVRLQELIKVQDKVLQQQEDKQYKKQKTYKNKEDKIKDGIDNNSSSEEDSDEDEDEEEILKQQDDYVSSSESEEDENKNDVQEKMEIKQEDGKTMINLNSIYYKPDGTPIHRNSVYLEEQLMMNRFSNNNRRRRQSQMTPMSQNQISSFANMQKNGELQQQQDLDFSNNTQENGEQKTQLTSIQETDKNIEIGQFSDRSKEISISNLDSSSKQMNNRYQESLDSEINSATNLNQNRYKKEGGFMERQQRYNNQQKLKDINQIGGTPQYNQKLGMQNYNKRNSVLSSYQPGFNLKYNLNSNNNLVSNNNLETENNITNNNNDISQFDNSILNQNRRQSSINNDFSFQNSSNNKKQNNKKDFEDF